MLCCQGTRAGMDTCVLGADVPQTFRPAPGTLRCERRLHMDERLHNGEQSPLNITSGERTRPQAQPGSTVCVLRTEASPF